MFCLQQHHFITVFWRKANCGVREKIFYFFLAYFRFIPIEETYLAYSKIAKVLDHITIGILTFNKLKHYNT